MDEVALKKSATHIAIIVRLADLEIEITAAYGALTLMSLALCSGFGEERVSAR
jgi:hypothetical protein